MQHFVGTVICTFSFYHILLMMSKNFNTAFRNRSLTHHGQAQAAGNSLKSIQALDQLPQGCWGGPSCCCMDSVTIEFKSAKTRPDLCADKSPSRWLQRTNIQHVGFSATFLGDHPHILLTPQTGGSKSPPLKLQVKSATTDWAHHVGSSRSLITIVVMTLFVSGMMASGESWVYSVYRGRIEMWGGLFDWYHFRPPRSTLSSKRGGRIGAIIWQWNSGQTAADNWRSQNCPFKLWPNGSRCSNTLN